MSLQEGETDEQNGSRQKCHHKCVVQNNPSRNMNKTPTWRNGSAIFCNITNAPKDTFSTAAHGRDCVENYRAMTTSKICDRSPAYHHSSISTLVGENGAKENENLGNGVTRNFSVRDVANAHVSMYLNGRFLWNKIANLETENDRKTTRLYRDIKVSVHMNKKLLWKRDASFTLKDLCLPETNESERPQSSSSIECVDTSLHMSNTVMWTRQASLTYRDVSIISKCKRQALELTMPVPDETPSAIISASTSECDESQQWNRAPDKSNVTFFNCHDTSEEANIFPLDEFPTYAYIDENNRAAFIINKNTTRQQLGQLMNIQKGRDAKKLPRLKFYEVKRSPLYQVVRIIQDGEPIPLNFATNQKIKESKVDIIKRAFSIMQEEIEKACTHGITSCDKIQERLHHGNLKFPTFVEPCMERLRFAHAAIERFLPHGDCEPFDSVCIAKRYYDYFRPEKVRVILLAESHAYDDDECININRPIIGYDHISALEYDGPREFVALVYCLAYGEESILEKRDCEKSMYTINALKSKGTPQFWKLFAACAGDERDSSGSFGSTLLKSKTHVCERIRSKLNILKRLRDRGIWLLDTSIVAWYISQPTEYNITQSSKMIHKLGKARPPSNMKRETLILSWELYIKHVVKKAAMEGDLRLFIPIGKEVKDFISCERFTEAVTVQGVPIEEQCVVHHGIPAPNSWIPGKNGFDLVLSELASNINRVIQDFPIVD